MKMLTLAALLMIGVLIHNTTSINLTFIVRKDEENFHPSCVAEENVRYAALGWIYPIPDTKEHLPNITTKFLPTIINNFNCNFDKNPKCNKIWSIKNWQVDNNSTRTLDLMLDKRWEDLPTIYTNHNSNFDDRFEIPTEFQLGFSLRASTGFLLICDGWNPKNYPCYHLLLNENEIFLRKFTKLPNDMNFTIAHPLLDSYKAFANILSVEEWRNFIVKFDKSGIFELIDVSVNRTVIQFEDKHPLKPLYVFIKSDQPALWKIHQNNFLFTTTPQMSRMGPTLNLKSKDLCVSFYISTCPHCLMRFSTTYGTENQVLDEIMPTKFEWKFVKLKAENIPVDKVIIFVETKFSNGTNEHEGFWAIDDVRICHENEVKVTFLKPKQKIKEIDRISCQIVEQPKWRPKKRTYEKIKDFPPINNSADVDSINLSWFQVDKNNELSYFLSYKANDLCTVEPYNMKRIKSNGFLITKHNEITIDHLIPFTDYNLTISSVLHENEQNLIVKTHATEKPTLEEIPNKLQVQVTDTNAYVSWEQVPCSSVYGDLIYSIELLNVAKNISKHIKTQRVNVIEIDNLEPFTAYSLTLLTSRHVGSIEKLPMVVNFTTKAGIAATVENLEAYSADENSIALRYDLPQKSQGIPKDLKLERCNVLLFKKCKTTFLPLAKCPLWPKKYCVEVHNLIPHQKHKIQLSLKNFNTPLYGNPAIIEAFTEERIPAKPKNLSYHIVQCQIGLDYCHLNISWLHPYNQNGTINMFNIVLNGTDNNVTENIQEIFKIDNKTYSTKYYYQIKYVPYSTHYELYIQSANNKYKSDFANIHVKTDNIGDHIDQSPRFLGKSDKSLIFRVPPVDRRLASYKLTVVVQDYDKDKKIASELRTNKKISDHLCLNFGNTWVLDTVEITYSTANITIGTDNERNPYLHPNTKYCLTFIVTNTYKNTEHNVVYYEKLDTSSIASIEGNKTNNYGNVYILLILILLIPIGFVLHRFWRTRNQRALKNIQDNPENAYESLPFEECDTNCVNNDNYDELLHK